MNNTSISVRYAAMYPGTSRNIEPQGTGSILQNDKRQDLHDFSLNGEPAPPETQCEASAFLRLGILYRLTSQFEMSEIHLTQALLLCQAKPGKLHQFQVLREAGLLAYDNEKYAQAMELLEEALVQCSKEGTMAQKAVIVSDIGIVRSRLGDNSGALTCFFKSIELNGDNPVPLVIASTLNNIGNVYRRTNELEKALRYYNQALAIYEAANSTNAIASILGNIGLTFMELGNYTQAFHYHRRALSLLIALKRHPDVIKNLLNTGHLFKTQNKWATSQKWFLKAYNYARKHNVSTLLTTILGNLGEIFEKQGKFECAIEYFLKACDPTLDKPPVWLQCHMYSSLAGLYEQTGDLAACVKFLKLSAEAKEKLYNEEKQYALRVMNWVRDLKSAHVETEIYRKKNFELARALKEIKTLNQHLEHRDVEKNEILRIVAHDLKNPLATVELLSKLIRIQSERLSPVEIDEFTSSIESLVKQMFSMITNLLDINTIEEGKFRLNFEPCNFAAIVKRSVKNFREPARAKNILLKLQLHDEEGLVYADKNALLQILDNVISNAIKFSPLGKKIYVEVKTILGSIQCSVRDQGPGISASDKDMLFKKYARLSAQPTGHEHSSGIGLAIVKKLATNMHGDIYCESTLGEGATFVLNFPLVETTGIPLFPK